MNLMQTDMTNLLGNSKLGSTYANTLRSNMAPSKMDQAQIQTSPFSYQDMKKVLDRQINTLMQVKSPQEIKQDQRRQKDQFKVTYRYALSRPNLSLH